MEKVLDAAAELFARKGFKETTTRDIAAAADMLPGSIYYHFKTKDDLLLAVYQEGVRRINEAVGEGTKGIADPWERLERAVTIHLEEILTPSAYARVIVRVLPDNAPKVAAELASLRDDYDARIAALVQDLKLPRRVDRDLFRFFLLGAVNHVQAWYRPAAGARPEKIARQLVAIFRGSVGQGDA